MSALNQKRDFAKWSIALLVGGMLAVVSDAVLAQSPYFTHVQPVPPRFEVNEPFPWLTPFEYQPLPPEFTRPMPPMRVFGVRPYGAWNTYGYGSSRYIRRYGGAGSNLPPPEVVSPDVVPQFVLPAPWR
jgi:hypothetical protein